MRNVYSVSQINSYIRRMFTEDYLLRDVLVRGEVSNCKYHASGHIYFTIKDASGTLSCVMFAGRRRGLSFHMQNGDQVIVGGTIDVYARSGSYQLYAGRILRDGVGELAERFEMLKKKLLEQGMFDAAYKQPVPRYIRSLGVVTAATGAAVRDIIQIAKRRNPFYRDHPVSCDRTGRSGSRQHRARDPDARCPGSRCDHHRARGRVPRGSLGF